jgi:hypothetical protein
MHLQRFYDPIAGDQARGLLNQNLNSLKSGMRQRLRETTFADVPLTTSERAMFEDMLHSSFYPDTTDMDKIMSRIRLGNTRYSLDHLYWPERPEIITKAMGGHTRGGLEFMFKGHRREIRRQLVSNDMKFYSFLSIASMHSDALLATQEVYERDFIRPFYDDVISHLEQIDQTVDIREKTTIAEHLLRVLQSQQHDMQTFTQFADAFTTDLGHPEYYKLLTTLDGNGLPSRHRFFDLSQFPSLDPIFQRDDMSRDALYIPR